MTAVAAHLALYKFSLKTTGDAAASFSSPSAATPECQQTVEPLTPSEKWNEGAIYAYAQNLAKTVRIQQTRHVYSSIDVIRVVNGIARQYDDSYCESSLRAGPGLHSFEFQIFAQRIEAEFAGTGAEVIVRDEG